MGSGFAFSGAFTPTTIGLRAVQTGLPVCFGRFRGPVTGDVTGRLSARFMRGAVAQRPVYQFELDHRPLRVKDRILCFSFAVRCESAPFLCFARLLTSAPSYSFAGPGSALLFLCCAGRLEAHPLPGYACLRRSFAARCFSEPRPAFPSLCCARLGWSFPLRFTARPSAAPPLFTELLPR